MLTNTLKEFEDYLKKINKAFTPLSEKEVNIARTFWIAATSAMEKKVKKHNKKIIAICDGNHLYQSKKH